MKWLFDDGSPSGGAASMATTPPERLRAVTAFGSNPGALRMYLHQPSGTQSSSTARKRPLVVVLHGCTQTAAGYDAASGWSRLADAHDFLVVFAEQPTANNSGTCFSWFEPGDTTRGQGEVESIRQMIGHAITSFGADGARVFVTGLSAGGAMAAACLATYPDVFAGGAILAGLPYGGATNMSEAYQAMSVGRSREPKAWGDLVRKASNHSGSWPGVSIWHGTADTTVRPINAGELVKQWSNVHGVGANVPKEDTVGPATRRRWRDERGNVRVTEYSIAGLGHGAPIDDGAPPAPFFLPAGLSSTRQIAEDFGLVADSLPKRLLSLLAVPL